MKIKIISLCIIAACALVMVPLVPSVESATAHIVNDTYIVAQIKTIDPNILKEKLQNYDINKYPQQTIKKLIDVLNTELDIVLPGIIIYTLLFLGSFLQSIAIGPFLIIIGAWMEFFAIVLIDIVYDLGWEIYWPTPWLAKN